MWHAVTPDPHEETTHVASLPPVSSLFAAVLGENPVQHLLGPTGALASLPASAQNALTGTAFFPRLIAAPFHHGLVIVFLVAAGLSAVAAVASLARGGHEPPRGAATPPRRVEAAQTAR